MNNTKFVEKIKSQYEGVNCEKQESDIEKLRSLDKKVKKPVNIFSYTLGTVGALVLGTGMSMAMGSIGGGMTLGIIVGCAGLIASLVNYPINERLIKARKSKYAEQILNLSNNILEENN